MRIALFGATGGTGKQLIEQALEAGYEVVAYARNPSKLDIRHEHLKVIQGELADGPLIEGAVSGADAVISVLGPRGGSKERPVTQGMKNIIASMKRQSVRRLVVSSTLSARDPNDKAGFKTQTMIGPVRFTMRDAYEDIVSAAEAVRNSDLDWTIVRLSILNNNVRSGRVRAGYVGTGEVGTSISRADVADFMLKQIGDAKYMRQAPAISN
jgi:putative NADH-flavin reductase